MFYQTKKPPDELDFGFEVEIIDEKEYYQKENTGNSKNKHVIKSEKYSNAKNVHITNYLFINAKSYYYKSWIDYFQSERVNLCSLLFNQMWFEFFDMVGSKSYFRKIEEILTNCLSMKKNIIPYAELVFNIFNILSPDRIKIVIIGQDPYPGMSKIDGKMIPHAMGVSFSVPFNCPIPESLTNIYRNLLNFGHIKKIPTNGNLIYWILQGCFMINASLTTFVGERNVHKHIWYYFTNDLLDYLINKFDKLIFMVWGRDAHLLCRKIDPKKHYIITSSHPSPLSFEKTFTGMEYGISNDMNVKRVIYPSFKDTDHFGKANEYLESSDRMGIFWDLID